MYSNTEFGLFGYFIVLVSQRLDHDCLIGEFGLQIFLRQVFEACFYYFALVNAKISCGCRETDCI